MKMAARVIWFAILVTLAAVCRRCRSSRAYGWWELAVIGDGAALPVSRGAGVTTTLARLDRTGAPDRWRRPGRAAPPDPNRRPYPIRPSPGLTIALLLRAACGREPGRLPASGGE